MKVLFLGSSHFSKIVLEKMLEKEIDVCAIITQPDRPSGRGHKLTPTEVKTFAIAKGIEVFTFEKVRKNIEEIKQIDYDIAVVASFGQILPQSFLDIKLTINVHPSLLPKYRGATPMQNAILNGDEKTGVTIMKVAKEVDSGDIILQKEVILNDEYYSELEEKLGVLGGEMISDVIEQIRNETIKFVPQDHEKAVLVQKFTKEDGYIDLNENSKNIVNKVRALSEELGCFIKINGNNLKIGKVQDVTKDFEVEKGYILNNKKRFVVGCDGGAVEILTCQAPSGKMVAGRDYLNGHNEILGSFIL